MPTLFSKIVAGEIPCHRIYEDDAHLAFLDIHPLAPGHTLVIPKRESSDVFDLSGQEYADLWLTAQKVAHQLKRATQCKRVAILVLGYEVNHSHIHLIPTNSESDILPPIRTETTSDELAQIAAKLTATPPQGEMPCTEAVAERWNQMAACFTDHIEPTTLELARSAFPHLKLNTATAVLEIGCGGGAASEALFPLLPEDAKLTASDISFEMIGIARDRLDDQISTFLADAQDLPFENEEFDRILANLNLMLVPDPKAAAREAFRVLKPGGVVLYTVWGRSEHSPLMTTLPQAAVSLGIQLPPPPRSNFHLGGPDALKSLLADAGFTGIRHWYQPMIAPIESGEDFIQWNKEMMAMMDIPDDKRTELNTAICDRIDALLNTGQAIQLDIRVAVATKPMASSDK